MRAVGFEEELIVSQVYPRRSTDEHRAIPGLSGKPGIPGLRKAILGLRKFPVCAEQLYCNCRYTLSYTDNCNRHLPRYGSNCVLT